VAFSLGNQAKSRWFGVQPFAVARTFLSMTRPFRRPRTFLLEKYGFQAVLSESPTSGALGEPFPEFPTPFPWIGVAPYSPVSCGGRQETVPCGLQVEFGLWRGSVLRKALETTLPRTGEKYALRKDAFSFWSWDVFQGQARFRMSVSSLLFRSQPSGKHFCTFFRHGPRSLPSRR